MQYSSNCPKEGAPEIQGQTRLCLPRARPRLTSLPTSNSNSFSLQILPDINKPTIFVRIYKHTHTHKLAPKWYFQKVNISTPYLGLPPLVPDSLPRVIDSRSPFHSVVSAHSGICANMSLPQGPGTGCSFCLESSFLRFLSHSQVSSRSLFKCYAKKKGGPFMTILSTPYSTLIISIMSHSLTMLYCT